MKRLTMFHDLTMVNPSWSRDQCYKIVMVKVIVWTRVALNHSEKGCRYSSSGLPRPSNNF